MATNSATVVAASLDSSQLEASINSLVNMVAQKTKAMADNFTSEVGRMEQAIKNLGNIKIDSGGAADGGSSRRTSSLKQEEQQVKNVATSYDGLARAQQTAIGSRGGSTLKKDIDEAANSYSGLIQQIERTQAKFNISPIQSLRMRQHELEAGMQTAANEAAKAKKDVDELNAAISNYRKTLETLPKDQQGFANRQAIQKEINDLVTLRDASVSEQQKWTNAGRVLATQYESVKGEIRQIGQALIDSEKAEKQVTSELDKQLQKVKEINSSKSAKAAYESISSMPTNTIDQVEVKLQALQALKEKVANTPLLSKSSQSQLTQAITDTKLRIEQLESSVRGTNQSKKSLDELNAAVAQTIRREEERRNAILQTGIAAQESFAKIRQSTQIQLADNTDKPIMGVKELTEAIRNMERAYWGMDAINRESPLGQSLKRDIENAQKLRTAIEAYNKTLTGLPVIQDKTGVDKTLGSYNELSNILKTLSDEYRRLGREERNAAKGNDLADKIQRLGRETQKIQQQMNRPINLDAALKGSEKTIDDITYKIQRLQSYKVGIDLTKPNAANEIKQVDEAILRLQKDMDKYLGKSKDIIANNNALGRSWNYMKNRLAFYFTVGASTQFVKNLIEIRSQYEMNERALGILVNSAERGTQIFNELSQMALVSPYTLIELSAAAKQLTAYDVAAKDVVDTTRRLADMAAAVGIPIERLTYALGQIKAYGYLNARDARMFANAGIPLVKQLSEYYTELEGRLVSTADIYDRIKKKSIGYEEVTSVIARMTDEGGKFYDFQAKMAETLKVQLANLTLAWNNMLNAMGEESQGVLVGSISTLKQVFLHWKDIEHVLYELIVAFGAYKAYQIITTRLMGATAASLDAQVLAIKRNNAAMLEKQALTRKLTVDELGQVAAQKMVTAADYQNALSGKQLTKQKALLLAAIYKNNVQLKAALVNMGLLTTAEATSITRGKALAIVFKSIGISIKNAALAIRAFAASMWPLLVMGAIYELYHAWDSYGEHVKEVNKQATEHAKEAFENIKQYLESESTINTRQRVVYKEGNPLTDAESQKAWDEMREKIELSSSASNTFIAKLMQIDNINNRLAAGFDYLKDVQRVAGVMQTLEEDAVGVSSTTLGGLFGEGLKDDLVDFINAYQKYISLNENLKQGVVGENYFNEQKKALEEFRGEVEKTTTSLYNIASKEGFNTNEQREFLEREISEIAQAEQMGAKETRIFRMQAEKEYYTYARAQLVAQLEYQDGAQKALTQKRINDLDNEFGKSKALQEGFFTWLTEKQDHAVKNMLRGKTLEEIEQGEWLKGANAKWVEEMARKFSKEYGVSFDDLHKLVLNANTWSINIPVFFQTIGQPLSDVQRDYEARTGKKFSNNPIIKDAKTQVDIIDTLKKKQKEVANEMETARKAGGKYWEDNKQRYKEENDALVADIHAYNALTDAEEKANKKSGKGSSKKDPLLDALKQEISLVEKLQSDYDKLSKSGASQTDALDTIRGAYGKTIRLLNTQLQSYGLPQIDISQLITGKDPNKTLNHFKQTLDTLVSKGMLTLERSKELEAVVEKFTLSAKTYNLDKITKGLNNELDRLKDEYELAVSLDADPELGNMFADWMGIDVSDLPRTASEYAERASEILNNKLKDLGSKTELPSVLDITDDDMRAFEENKVFTDKQLELVKKAVEAARGFQKKETEERIKDWDKLLEKYAEYETKVNKIQNDAARERVAFAQQFGSDEERSTALKLQTQILAATDPNERQQLIQQLQELVKSIAGDDKTKINLVTSINNSEQQGLTKASFEEFQKTPEWLIATGDLSTLTDRALGGLIRRIEEYKKKAKNLDPKQIKNLNNALKNLRKQQREGNPFLQIANAIDEAQERAAELKPEMDSIMSDIIALEEEIGDSDATEEQEEHLKTLKERWKDLAEQGNVSATAVVGAINSSIAAASQAVSMFTDMADALGGQHMTEATQTIKDVTGVLEKAGQGAAIGAQIGGGWGALVGGVAGGLAGLITNFADRWSGNKAITDSVKDSERAVRRLELAYVDLQQAVDKAYGTAVIGAKQATLANKELQLAEIQRQIELEKSRKSKNRDEDRIIELEKQYKELFYEIRNGYTEIVDDLMGTDVGSFAENLVSSMIDAFKQGEDYMKVFSDSFDEMIDNMIMKSIVSRVVAQYLDSIWEDVNKHINERTKEESEDAAKAKNEAVRRAGLSNDEARREIASLRSNGLGEYLTALVTVTQRDIDDYKKAALDEEKAMQARLKAASAFTGSDVDYVMQRVTEIMPELGQKLKDILGEYYKFGESSETQLSALQQGLQGVSEETAGAVEAYLNGMSQQAYLRNDLLTQIRDAVVGFNLDVQVATMSQILLQLQSSYTVQMSIQGILEGWSSPSGLAVRVEMQ